MKERDDLVKCTMESVDSAFVQLPLVPSETGYCLLVKPLWFIDGAVGKSVINAADAIEREVVAVKNACADIKIDSIIVAQSLNKKKSQRCSFDATSLTSLTYLYMYKLSREFGGCDVTLDVTKLWSMTRLNWDTFETKGYPVKCDMTNSELKVGDVVRINADARSFTGRFIPTWMMLRTFEIIWVKSNSVVILANGTQYEFALKSVTKIDTVAIQKFYAGDQLITSNDKDSIYLPVYMKSTSGVPTMVKFDKLFVYDGRVFHGKIRVTEDKKNVNKQPASSHIDGWISMYDIVAYGVHTKK